MSPREIAILRGLVAGQTLREIAVSLHLSHTMIEHGSMNLRRRLGLRNKVQLAVWAVFYLERIDAAD